MTSFLTTSEERDLFLQWLEGMKDDARNQGQALAAKRGHNPAPIDMLDYWHAKGRYEAFLNVLAYIKTGGKLA